MARFARPTFNVGQPFIASRPFLFSGVQHDYGDPFDWQDLECDMRKLQQLYDARKIVNQPQEITLQQPEPGGDDPRIVPTGKGWFEVIVDGHEPVRERGKKAALAKLEELTAAPVA